MLDKSWQTRADKYSKDIQSVKKGDNLTPEDSAKLDYLSGASDYQAKLLDALDKFSAMTVDEVFQHNGKLYVSLPDVIALTEGLYAETIYTEVDE